MKVPAKNVPESLMLLKNMVNSFSVFKDNTASHFAGLPSVVLIVFGQSTERKYLWFFEMKS
ncbi:MAG: hypothetical protein PVS2B2_28070 [Candidatus Acidiferrum sp.]